MKRLPIIDVQYHRKGLNHRHSLHSSRDRNVLENWHTAAIFYLQCGLAAGLDSPAASVNGVPSPIEDWLYICRGPNGIELEVKFKD